MTRRRPRVCFVALQALPLFDARVSTPFGGMETRAWLFARGLARQGRFDVWFVIRDDRRSHCQQVDGITVVPFEEHPRGVQSFRPRVNPFYEGVDADVYVPFGVNGVTAEVVRTAEHVGASSVVCIASDSDLSNEYRAGSRSRNQFREYGNACHYALTRGDALVVQTCHQQQLASERFGIEAHRVLNPIELPTRRRSAPPEPRRRYVLWVGRSDTFHKRPELCLEVARRCPDVPFVLVMNRFDARTHDRVERNLSGNVVLIDDLPFDAMQRWFRDAAAFVSTSSSAYEGFPNVFLQAGSHGVPVLSLEADPDGLLRGGAGWVADGDVAGLSRTVTKAWREPASTHASIQRMWDYVWSHHSLEDRAAELGQLIEGTRCEADLRVAA